MTAVSVCIASYNHARYLSRCLDSILAQTFQDYKIVVVDDGSQDHSLEILDEYQKRFPEKIRFYCHPGNSNRGISYTTNTTIRLSDGEYIATIGSDDLWYPEKLELQVALLEQHPEFGYVYSYADFIDQDDHPLPGRYGVDITQDPNPVGQMILSCHQPAMTVLFRRDFLNKIEWFDETLIYSDWDLMLRMTALWPAGFTDRPLAKYRIHGKNISKHIDPKVDLQRILDFTQAVQRNSTGIGGRLIDPRNLALLNLQLAFFHFCLPNKQEAIKYIRLAFEVDETLGQDIRYINGWLSGWKPEFYTTENDCFGLWFIHHLPESVNDEGRIVLSSLVLSQQETQQFFVNRGMERGKTGRDIKEIFSDVPASISLTQEWKKNILKQIYPALLFDAYQKGEMKQVRYIWKETIRLDHSWLKNRGVLSIGLRAFLKWIKPSQVF